MAVQELQQSAVQMDNKVVGDCDLPLRVASLLVSREESKQIEKSNQQTHAFEYPLAKE